MTASPLDALVGLALTSLVGLTVTEARARVEQLGGELRVVVDAPVMPIDAMFRPNRVTVIVQDDRVIRTLEFLG